MSQKLSAATRQPNYLAKARTNKTQGSQVKITVHHVCWREDYIFTIDTHPAGRYFRRYDPGGKEYLNAGPTQFKAKVGLPVKSAKEARPNQQDKHKTPTSIKLELEFSAIAMPRVTPEQLAEAKKKLEAGIKDYWNKRFKIEIDDSPTCGKLTLAVEFAVKWVSAGKYVLKVFKEFPRPPYNNNTREHCKEDTMITLITTSSWVYAHEYGHCIGLPDEYSYTADKTESLVYIKPDGSEDGKFSFPAIQSGSDSTLMSTADNKILLPRHCWPLAREVLEYMKRQTGRRIKCVVEI